jgi:hypothetical protein
MVTGTEILATRVAIECIGKYIGIINSTSTDIKKMMHKDLLSANELLNDAKQSEMDGNRRIFLKEALSKFTDAVQLEEDEAKITALAGKSMCHFLLNEKELAFQYRDKINEVRLSKMEDRKGRVKDFAKGSSKYLMGPVWGNILGPYLDTLRFRKMRILSLEVSKKKWIKELDEMFSVKL